MGAFCKHLVDKHDTCALCERERETEELAREILKTAQNLPGDKSKIVLFCEKDDHWCVVSGMSEDLSKVSCSVCGAPMCIKAEIVDCNIRRPQPVSDT